MVEWEKEKHTVLTAEEVAQAVVDLRVINFSSLIPDRGGPTQRSKGMETHVRERDLEYARALLTRIVRNRG